MGHGLPGLRSHVLWRCEGGTVGGFPKLGGTLLGASHNEDTGIFGSRGGGGVRVSELGGNLGLGVLLFGVYIIRVP